MLIIQLLYLLLVASTDETALLFINMTLHRLQFKYGTTGL